MHTALKQMVKLIVNKS